MFLEMDRRVSRPVGACWSLLGVEYSQQADARREEQPLFRSPELELDQVPPLNSSCSYPK